MLHDLVLYWFQIVQSGGYWGVFILMALESTIVPIPSELILPPAAFWAAQGHMSFTGVVVAGTAGSYFGSVISYFVAKALGQKFVEKYGKYVLLSMDKILASEKWVKEFGPVGVFSARLIPVIRHLISIPAGFFKMNFKVFSIATLTGAGLWCFILSLFGQKILGQHPEMLNSPEEMVHMIKAELFHFVIGVIGLLGLYILFVVYKNRRSRRAATSKV